MHGSIHVPRGRMLPLLSRRHRPSIHALHSDSEQLTRHQTVLHDSLPDSFLAPRPDQTNQRPRHVTPSESARLVCCVNPSRSSGSDCLNLQCESSQRTRVVNPRMFLTPCQSQSTLSTSRFCCPRAPDSNPSATRNANLERLPVMWQLALFRHWCISFWAKCFVRLPTLPRWSAHGVPLPLAPTRFGHGDVSLVPLRVLRRSLSVLWHPLAHVALPPLPCQQPLPLCPRLSMHSWSTRKTPLHQIFSCCRRSKEMPAKHHVPRRSRPSGLRISCPVAA